MHFHEDDDVEEMHEVKPSFALDDAPRGGRRDDSEIPATEDAAGLAGNSRFFNDEEKPTDAVDDRSNRLRRESLLPMNFVLDQLRLEVDRSDLYVDLIIFIPFLVLFIVLFQMDRDVEKNFYVMNAIRSQYQNTEFPQNQYKLDIFRQEMSQGLRLWVELDKHYFDIGNQGDWGSFLTDVIVNTTWDCSNMSVKHPGLWAARGQMLLIGALRLRTLRNRIDSCAVDTHLYPSNLSAMPRSCFATNFDRSNEDRSQLCPSVSDPINTSNPYLFTYYGADEVPGISILGNLDTIYPNGGHIFQLPFNDYSCGDAFAAANQAVNNPCAFADNWGTRFIAIEFFIYTPHSDTFHSVKYFSEVTASGWWWNNFQLRSFSVYSPKDQPQLTFAGIFFVFILYYVFSFVYQAIVAAKEKRLMVHILQLWTFFEAANLACFMATFIIHFIWVTKSLAAAESVKFPFAQTYPDHLDVIQALYYTVVVVNCVNTIITFLKLLKYVRLNAQFGVITRTLAAAAQGLVGVLVLFGFVVTSYAIAGWSLFGINMPEFRNIGTAFSSLLRLLVGESKYDDMKAVNRFLAGAYFWSFLILALYLLLNSIIAILSDTFAKISGRAVTMSMNEAIVRKIQFFRLYLKPSNLFRIARGIVTRNSESKYILRVIEQLQHVAENEEAAIAEQRIQRKKMRAGNIDGAAAWPFDPVLDDDEPIIVHMKFADFLTWVDPELYQGLTQLYFEYTWDDLINEYDDYKKASEEVDRKQMMTMVEAGVMRVVANDLTKVDQLDHVLETLESHVEAMIEAVVATRH